MEVSNSESAILISESFIKWVRMERYIEEVGMDMPVRGGDNDSENIQHQPFTGIPSRTLHSINRSYNQKELLHYTLFKVFGQIGTYLRGYIVGCDLGHVVLDHNLHQLFE